jgi:hypothetical protein
MQALFNTCEQRGPALTSALVDSSPDFLDLAASLVLGSLLALRGSLPAAAAATAPWILMAGESAGDSWRMPGWLMRLSLQLLSHLPTRGSSVSPQAVRLQQLFFPSAAASRTFYSQRGDTSLSRPAADSARLSLYPEWLDDRRAASLALTNLPPVVGALARWLPASAILRLLASTPFGLAATGRRDLAEAVEKTLVCGPAAFVSQCSPVCFRPPRARRSRFVRACRCVLTISTRLRRVSCLIKRTAFFAC